MNLFDPLLRSGAGVRTADLQTLAFFGVQGAVLAPATAPPAADWREVVDRLEAVVGPDRRRLETAGVRAWSLVGVHPCWASPKSMHKVVHRLPELLARPGVVGVGEIGLQSGTPPELDLLDRHLEAAADAGLPAVLHVAEGADRYRLTRLALDAVLASPLAPDRVLVAATTPELLELVTAAGVKASVTVGGCPDERATGVAFLREHGPDGLLVDGGVGEGAFDVLGLPKAAQDLLDGGWSAAEVRQVFLQNALTFYRISETNRPSDPHS
jgi:predicted metal-dependent TIM-barrel fold hydrolase